MKQLPVLPMISSPLREIATSLLWVSVLTVSLAVPNFSKLYTGLITLPIFFSAYAYGITTGVMSAAFWLFFPIFLREVLNYPIVAHSIEAVWQFRLLVFALSILIGYMSDLNTRLRNVIDENNSLRGIIPVCARCKKIRNDEGYWEEIELYIRSHSDAEISHGLCLDCAKALYPDNAEELEKIHYDTIVNNRKDIDPDGDTS